MSEPLLRVAHLTTAFDTDSGVLKAVDDVSFDVPQGETVAVVGESGCGKSVTALSVLRLVPDPPGRITGGSIELAGTDLLKLSEKEMRSLRGARISMIFQEPMTSLNPVYTVGSQIGEVLRIHRGMKRRETRRRAVELLAQVGIPAPEQRVDSYAHQLSGGMRQRVMIAMALACDPDLLLADEPTTALDVTIQAQILDLLRRLQEERGMSILFITHDLGVVAEFASRVVVMYAGQVVETGTTQELFEHPLHPYSRGLLDSVPPMTGSSEKGPRRLPTIEGMVPDLRSLKPGCRFADRCGMLRQKPDGHERCTEQEPPLSPHEDREVRCYFPGQLLAGAGAQRGGPALKSEEAHS